MTLPTPNSIFNLEGKTALVTGSGRGIGATIALALAGAKAKVILHGSSKESTDSVFQQMQQHQAEAFQLGIELSEQNAGKELIEKALPLTGKVDILVINASAQINQNLDELTEEDFRLQFEVNLKSTLDMLQTLLPIMQKNAWGRIVNIGSINQLFPKPIVTAYAMTKAAQHNLIQSQAREYAKYGVLLNTLAPGLIDTDRNKDRKENAPEEWKQYVRQLNWMGRAGETSEMIGAALFLSSDACSFMTGESIVLSGGF